MKIAEDFDVRYFPLTLIDKRLSVYVSMCNIMLCFRAVASSHDAASPIANFLPAGHLSRQVHQKIHTFSQQELQSTVSFFPTGPFVDRTFNSYRHLADKTICRNVHLAYRTIRPKQSFTRQNKQPAGQLADIKCGQQEIQRQDNQPNGTFR